jgi:hypothetical protein
LKTGISLERYECVKDHEQDYLIDYWGVLRTEWWML